MNARKAKVQRKTRETDISVEIDLDGAGRYAVRTGIPFLNHMLELLSKHSLIDLKLKAKGDLPVDYHHVVEDIGLCLGQALNEALGVRRSITRYGWALVPMDDALTRVAVDLGGRPYLICEITHRQKKIRDFDLGLIREFFRAFSTEGRFNLHITQLCGNEPHHVYESVFKGVARALRTACEKDRRVEGIPSSKGKI